MRYSSKLVLQIEDQIGEYTVLESDVHEYDGPVDKCCGPSGEEQGLQASSSNFANTLQGAFSTTFGQQQNTLTKLNAVINRIQSGNTGPGFGGAENAALISGIVNAGGAAARNATQAVQDRSAGQVFAGQTDSSGLARASAIRKQMAAQIASNVGANTANALTAETAANYATGRQTAQTAAADLSSMVGQEGAIAGTTMKGAINENAQSFGQANEINQEQNQMESDIAGLATGAVKLGASVASGGLTGGFSGALKALGGGK